MAGPDPGETSAAGSCGRYRLTMLDIKLLRTDPDAVKAAIARRGDDTSGIDRAVELDASVRAVGTERDDIRSRVNALSKEIGALHRDGKGDEASALQDESKALGEREKSLAAEADGLGDFAVEVPSTAGKTCAISVRQDVAGNWNFDLSVDGKHPGGGRVDPPPFGWSRSASDVKCGRSSVSFLALVHHDTSAAMGQPFFGRQPPRNPGPSMQR